MGGDCGGAADVFVDENVPADLLAETTPLDTERTVVIHSGRVVVDGVEYFGDARHSPERSSAGCRVPNGTYLLRIRVAKDEDQLSEPHSEKEIRRIIGADDMAFYDRTNRKGLLIGLSTLLLLPVLLYLSPWFIAVAVTLIVFIAYFHFLQWFLRRNPRYQKVAEKIVPLRIAGEHPLLTIQLSTWDGALLGGPALGLPSEKL